MNKEFKSKWWESMIAKHGSEEAVREFMARSGQTASRPGTGGFAYMKRRSPKKLQKIAKKGGKSGRAVGKSRWDKELSQATDYEALSSEPKDLTKTKP